MTSMHAWHSQLRPFAAQLLCVSIGRAASSASIAWTVAHPNCFLVPTPLLPVQVIVAASSTEDFESWAGFMNTRVKHLTARLHNMSGQLLARPWPKDFKIPMCAPAPLLFC